ncbi:NYN domain-containing protein [soil metagenome]
MARWLVDGMNVIGSRPDGWWRDRRGAQRALVEQLRAFAGEGGHEVTVVFDGSPYAVEGPTGGVRVLFASRTGRDAADDDIAALARRGATALTVVTSDADLAARVKAHGAEVAGAGSFRRLLDRE